MTGMDMDEMISALIDWIADAAKPAKGLLVPVSGGSDSALCFWLCCQAYPRKTAAVHAGVDLRDRAWFESVGTVEFTDTPGAREEREEMRWARFLSMSLARGAWLVGSRNKTEDLLGTFSLASRVATVLPLVDTWKSDVLAICRKIGVPDGVIASSLKADPDCGRPAELAEIPYEAIERHLRSRLGFSESADAPLSDAQRRYLDGIYARNAFKRSLPSRPSSALG